MMEQHTYKTPDVTKFRQLTDFEPYFITKTPIHDMFNMKLDNELNSYINKKSYEKGKNEKEKEIRKLIESEMIKYFAKNLEIIINVYENLKKTDLKIEIKEIRIQDPVLTQCFNIFFIIKAKDFDNDMNFGKFISNLEKFCLNKMNIYVDMLYVSDEGNINPGLMNHDYPIKVNLNKV